VRHVPAIAQDAQARTRTLGAHHLSAHTEPLGLEVPGQIGCAHIAAARCEPVVQLQLIRGGGGKQQIPRLAGRQNVQSHRRVIGRAGSTGGGKRYQRNGCGKRNGPNHAETTLLLRRFEAIGTRNV